MVIQVNVNELDIKKMVAASIFEKTNIEVPVGNIKFLVKTTQNYKAEWEEGRFQCTVTDSVE